MNKLLLFFLFLLTKSIYLPLNKRKSKYYWKIKIDDYIPLIPIFIVPYLGYLLYITLTVIFLWNTAYINNFFITYIISYIISGVFWFFIPNGVKRPKISNKGIFNKLTQFVYEHDGDTNGFPSAHVLASFICSYFLYITFPEYLTIIWVTNYLICISTIFVKQHYVLDILGGVLFFWISIVLSNMFMAF